MARQLDTEVLVVGAGPVGLLAALSLAERGIEVEIVDEAWRPATHGYALALHPHSVALLARVGIAERLLPRGQRIDSVAFYEGDTRQAELDLGRLEASFPYVLALPQRFLENALQARLREHKVKIRWHHRLADFQLEDDRVVATVNRLDRVSGGYPVATMSEVVVASSTVRAAFLVGADGHHSLVRRKLGAELETFGQPRRFGVFEFLTELTNPSEMRVVFDGAVTSGLWPLVGGRCRWSFELDEAAESGLSGDRRQVTQEGPADYPKIAVERLAELVATRAPWFGERMDEVLWSVEVVFERRLANTFGRGRAWLAGDAAHVMFPIGMHSMNVGLAEAHRLAAAIADRLRGPQPSGELEPYGAGWRDELRVLVAPQEDLVARGGAVDWVRGRRGRIAECVPAAGGDLTELLRQLGLERPA